MYHFQSKTSAPSLRTIAILFAILSPMAFLSPGQAFGQGKLSAISKKVHGQPRPPKQHQPQDDNRDRDDDDDRDRRDRHDSHRHHSSRSRRRPPRIRFHPAPPVTFVQPPIVLVDPILPPVVVDAPPIPTILEPTLAPAPAISSEPLIGHSVIETIPSIEQEIVVVEEPQEVFESVGHSWFENTNSKLWATFGSDFDDITLGNFGALLQAKNGPGLSFSFGTLRESGADYRDHLWLGDVNFVIQFLNQPRIKSGIGVGINWLSSPTGYDDWEGDVGANLKLFVDLKLTDRLSVSADSNWGTVGQSDLTRTRISLNRNFETVDWLVGAEHLNIGGVEINSAFTGLQFRF